MCIMICHALLLSARVSFESRFYIYNLLITALSSFSPESAFNTPCYLMSVFLVFYWIFYAYHLSSGNFPIISIPFVAKSLNHVLIIFLAWRNKKHPSQNLSHHIRLCRYASYNSTEDATAAFRDSTFPSMGIFTNISAQAAVSFRRPLPSFPIKKAVLLR